MSKSKSGLGKSGIPYITHTCNIVVGCLHRCLAHLKDKHGEPVKCWAEQLAYRIGCATGCELCKTFTPHIHPERWGQVTPKQEPKVIGIGFMGDICGEWNWLNANPNGGQPNTVGLLCAIAFSITERPRHTFVSLTQRPDRLPKLDYPDNWYIGPTVHNQAEADKRIAAVLASGVKHCIVSYEPATGPVDFRKWLGRRIPRCLIKCPTDHESCRYHSWDCHDGTVEDRGIECIIAGGMSGPGAVPADPEWFRRVRDDCAQAGVPFYFKQWGRYAPVPFSSEWCDGDVCVSSDGTWRPWTDDWANGEAKMRPFSARDAGRLLDGREHLELPWKMPVRKQKSPVSSHQGG